MADSVCSASSGSCGDVSAVASNFLRDGVVVLDDVFTPDKLAQFKVTIMTG